MLAPMDEFPVGHSHGRYGTAFDDIFCDDKMERLEKQRLEQQPRKDDHDQYGCK